MGAPAGNTCKICKLEMDGSEDLNKLRVYGYRTLSRWAVENASTLHLNDSE